jgi:D-alanine-D-alanine ligase
MKIAIVYNRGSKNVINLFGQLNQEKIGLKTIQRILNALKKNKHQVIALEGDKSLIPSLEEFMPRVLKGERPGIVFNLSYGIQGEARYTHVPSILEMIGIPYVASGPLAHSLALDKLISKTIFRQHGLPTPDFAVLNDPGFTMPELSHPLIVKPKNESVSFGIRVVSTEQELRDAAQVIFDKFSQPVLVEQYIEGREINVGLLGNDLIEAFPPAEIVFDDGPKVYSYEDKTGRSGREIKVECPASLSPEKASEAQQLAKDAFRTLGCRDCARVDMRMDENGNFFILEINSLPSLGEHGSYTHGAAVVGLDYSALINRLVEVAVARYFGTPKPLSIETNKRDSVDYVFQYITQRRDKLEKRLREWILLSSRTSDPVGLQEARKELRKILENIKLKPVQSLTDERSVWTWETEKGMKNGTLLVVNLDIPIGQELPHQGFRRLPDRLYGEGIGSSRGGLVVMEFSLNTLRSLRRLKNMPLGVLLYSDEGQDNRYSRDTIQLAAGKVKKVLILRPGVPPNCFVNQRRGQIKYRLAVEGESRRLGQVGKRLDAARWTIRKIGKMCDLSNRKAAIAVGLIDFSMHKHPMRMPHYCQADLLLSYLNKTTAQQIEKKMREILGKEGYVWILEKISERPPMKEKRGNQSIYKRLHEIAQRWEIPMDKKSSLWPSVAGLVPENVGVICGFGPVANDIYTPQESIIRISLVQRTLLLTHFLLAEYVK